jgi:predicted CXXCH cytochrome family protein
VPARRLPLNFPRADEPAARTPQEWASRRGIRAERLLWEKTCAECHHVSGAPQPSIAPATLQKQWMGRAAFDHMPHLMVRCESCHAAEQSRETSDLLMRAVATCPTCHAPDEGAASQCARVPSRSRLDEGATCASGVRSDAIPVIADLEPPRQRRRATYERVLPHESDRRETQ